MRIGVSGDWHTDNMGGTYLVKGRPNREIDIEKQVKFMAEKCKELNVFLFIIAGDLFSRTTTTGYYIAFVINLIEEFTKRGIIVKILPGNHDISESGRGLMPALEKLKYRELEIIEKKCIRKFGSTYIMFAPHERRDNFKGHKSYTHYLLDGGKWEKADLIVGHFQPKKSVPGSEESMFAGSTRFVDTTKFDSKIMLVNHVHKPQVIDKHVYLVGSPVRFNMGERQETKQFAVYDTKDKAVQTIDLDCQKMSKISINLVKKDSYSFPEEKIKKYKGHMVGIYIETIKENRPRISQIDIKSIFEKIGAHIIQFKIKTINTDIEQEKTKERNMSPESVFKRMVEKNVESEVMKKNVLRIGTSVLDQLKEEQE